MKTKRKSRSNPRRARKPRVYIESQDLQSEMESGAVISDARGGGYNLAFEGKFAGRANDADGAVRLAESIMHKKNYFPPLFYVNDHGNVDLLDFQGNILQSWV